jgi:putative ABC transport system ATP-binding protein
MMNLLTAKNLSHSFDYPLFDDVSFDLAEGGSMAITGVSGSGKSTLLHICATLLAPNKGEVYVQGKNLYALPPNDLITMRREQMGIIFQSHFLFKGFNARENIELSTILSGTEPDPTLSDRLGISHILGHKVGDISGGQQQRVSIARVLAKKPKIIFADEPTGNLDHQTADEVMNILYEYIRTHKAALLLVTHDDELAHRCQKVYRLENLQLTTLK